MRIGSPAPPARRNGLSDLAMRVIVTTLALVIVPVTAVSQQENPRRRWEYFYQQRAYPFDRIPAGALQAARQQEVARWPSQFAQRARFASTWTQIGPAQIVQATNLAHLKCRFESPAATRCSRFKRGPDIAWTVARTGVQLRMASRGNR